MWTLKSGHFFSIDRIDLIRSALESWDLQENQKIFFMKKIDLTRPQSLCISKAAEEKWGRKLIINYSKTINFTAFLKWLRNVYTLRSSDNNFYFHEKYKSSAFKWRVYSVLIRSRSISKALFVKVKNILNHSASNGPTMLLSYFLWCIFYSITMCDNLKLF